MSKKLKYAVIVIVVFSFMFFGIYSTIAARKSYVAKVDDVKITRLQLNRYTSERKQQIFSNVEGSSSRKREAVAFTQSPQFEDFILNEMINAIVISKFLKDNGIHIKPEILIEYIKNISAFQKEGEFDIQYFKQYLEYLNISEYNFLQKQVPEIEQNIFDQMLSALRVGDIGRLQEEHARAIRRKRNVEVLTLNTPKFQKPTDDELHKFYEIQEKFVEQPKHYVSISYIDDYITKHTNVFHATPSMIANYYNDSYMGKVMKIYYVKVIDESKANILHSITTKQGISLQSAVETMLKKPLHHIKGNGFISSDKIDDSRIISAIRDLQIGNITPIIEIDNELYIAQIVDIKEDTFLNSEQSKAINDEIMHQRKCNNVKVYTEKLRKEFESGLSFNAVSLKYGFPVSARIIVDEGDGSVKNQQSGKDISVNRKLVNHILHNDDTSYGYVFNIDPKNCSFVAYKQERITKERIKNLPEVRGNVIQMYNKWKKHESLHSVAKNIVDQVTSLKNDLSQYTSYGKVTNKSVAFSQDVSGKIFTRPIGSVFIYNNNNNNVQIIRITGERKYHKNLTAEEIKNNSAKLQESYYNAFLKEFINELYKRYKVHKMI